MEWTRGALTISTDQARLDREAIHEFLRNSYWARGIPRTVVDESIENALCFGLYEGGRQVGFARVITDFATFAYLSDVFVIESHRGLGLSKWLMEVIMGHPQLQNLRRWMLATRDAHGLYEQFGFRSPSNPERLMEIVDMDIYLRKP
ncbi:MAG TPA: GNAT family N-acetyltransferase [Thermoanaerobaculia bacterium]|nr:GNAT family N-acetyltransferase [Thermoanaerobaculia bacterium]